MFWIEPMMRRGAKQTLMEEDVWKLCPEHTSAVLHGRFDVFWQHEKLQPHPSFAKAMMRTMRSQWYFNVALYALYAALMLLQPNIIKSLLQFLQAKSNDDQVPVHTSLGISSGYALAALLTVHSFLSVTIIDFGQYVSSNLGVNAKSIVMDSVYLKSLKLSGFAKRNMSSGEIVTLSSVDSERLFQGFLLGPWVLVAPVTVLAVFIMIGFDLGALSGVVGGVVMAALLYSGYTTSTAVGAVRREILTVQSERVKLTNEMLQGVRVVKLYAWESPLEARIASIRDEELALLKKYQYVRVLNTVTLSIAPILSLVLCLAVYVAQGHELTPSLAFTALAYMNVARLPCTVFSSSIMFALEAWASSTRVGTFLLADEIAQVPPSPQVLEGAAADSSFAVEVSHGTFSWNIDPSGRQEASENEGPMTLKDISLTIAPNTLTIVVGPVGSGKSSLISALLGEIHQVSGSRLVTGRVAYVNQEAWIQHATLKDNILFTSAFDDVKYDRVVAACQLKADLAVLPDGDQTEIGERGINLSGGQKARVSLARAMYRSHNADLYLLDDPLSALDVHVAGAVFRECVQNLLADKTVVLVLNSHYHFLPHADRILVMEDGMIVGDGTFDSIKQGFPHLVSFTDVSEDPSTLVKADWPEEDASGGDDVVVKADEEKQAKAGDSKCGGGGGVLVQKEDRQMGGVSSGLYLTYLRSTGWNGAFVAVSIVVAFTISQTAVVATDWFMGFWSTHPGNDVTSVVVYVVLALVAMALVWGRSVYVLFLCVLCSKALHAKLFRKVIHAPVTTFFDITPVGRILNRFSSDLDQVDNILPFFGVHFLQFGFQIAAVIVVCATTSPFILLVYVPLVYLFHKVQVFFLLTSSELKRLESISRTPVINLISETIDGLSTIRAFGMTDEFAAKGRTILDHNQSYFMIYRISSRWMQMRLDWLSAGILAGVSFITVASKASIGITAAGLALTYVAQMSSFLSRMTMASSVIENIMTCVERLEHYNSLDTEGDSVNASAVLVAPPKTWPSVGSIEFKSFSMRYRPNLDLVLTDVSFEVVGGEKVGICGRTGSGKSSLMAALFRLVEGADGGHIYIDGVDIATVDLHTLRSRLTIIPQDPVLFSGSLRFNLDPANEVSDDELWAVLKKVHLADSLDNGGLEFHVAEKGSNLSVGQRQLLCIARALLRQSRVVVLDEATANIDLDTDRLIQETINECFDGVTMLVIAHRLDTILDSDRILVLDQGRVVEYDAPHALLATDGGPFAQLASHARLGQSGAL
ncbi:hypothetical protein H257_18968 [Aphanomyces astaci]|uniref:Uncharacterized protein n=2 Tax=Aphanomyces astaci TaxID=112090 RepID=W4FBC4_APHAT|nr:hypothetical protein H257_18968 [Aphanomyces astaci]ETV64096.1 hypothetical protein H257_18968 [Aphanomyces astaci]|eukprot:XP_009846421.1 hypothetical protein H257_18968 [Aphanomyces astaci]